MRCYVVLWHIAVLRPRWVVFEEVEGGTLIDAVEVEILKCLFDIFQTFYRSYNGFTLP